MSLAAAGSLKVMTYAPSWFIMRGIDAGPPLQMASRDHALAFRARQWPEAQYGGIEIRVLMLSRVES